MSLWTNSQRYEPWDWQSRGNCQEPLLKRKSPSAQAVEIIPGRYYVVVLRHPDGVLRSPIAASSICYCIDQDLVRAGTVAAAQSDLHVGQPPACAAAGLHAVCNARTSFLITSCSSCPLQLYEPFFQDFGPLNLGRTYRFCEITSRLLQVMRHLDQRMERMQQAACTIVL